MMMMMMMRGREDDGVYHCKNSGFMKIAIFLMARLRFKVIILLVSWYLVVPWSSNTLGLGSDQIMGGWRFSRKPISEEEAIVLWSEPVSRFTRYGYFYLEIHSFRAACRLRHTDLEHWVIGYQQRLLSGVFRNHGSPHFFPKKFLPLWHHAEILPSGTP